MSAAPKKDLLERVIERASADFATILGKQGIGGPATDEMKDALKAAILSGYPELVHDLDEARFMGEPMMQAVLRVGCLHIATRAFARTQGPLTTEVLQ